MKQNKLIEETLGYRHADAYLATRAKVAKMRKMIGSQFLRCLKATHLHRRHDFTN